ALGGWPGPHAFDLDGAEIRQLCCLAAGVVVVLALVELGPDGRRHQTAVCLSGDGVLGEQRLVPRDPLDLDTPAPNAFDTPLGRVGLLVGRDAAHPDVARALARDGAELLCASSGAGDLGQVSAPAREHRLFVVAAESCAPTVAGRAEVAAPSGEILAAATGPGSAVAEVDLQQVFRTRRQLASGAVPA
ncbi:MAG: carbon-nitrogen hydrolase family protein, partial [Frankiales bacterium]|nr:carbon-nitrogen hydrolase family protein [Frankiales bacterium]